MRFHMLSTLPLYLFCVAAGCQNAAGPQAGQIASARVIIGFDETVHTPDARLLANLGRELGCELQALQALGGNAYVYRCTTADTAESLTRKLDALGRHPGVRYAEMDRTRTIQSRHK
jgi:hypothetical protein